MKIALHTSTAALVITAALAATTGAALSRDTIQIAGSSTVLPFSSIVAEEYSAAFPEFKTPVVGSGGTGGGLRQFCEGVGDNTIDIANASRAMKDSEIDTCKAAGVTDIREVKIGYDGIVFASSAEKAEFALEPVHVYKAIAAQLFIDGEWKANPYKNWNEIDASLPDQAISLAIPASNHGTREVFEEKVTQAGFKASGAPENAPEDAATKLRQDVVIEISGDYTETLSRLQSNKDTIGVFGLSFYDQNKDTLQVATVSGVTPSLETVASGEYPVSRPLFFYVKGQHIGQVPGIEEFVQFYLSESVAGNGGILEDAGLIPAPAEELEATWASFEAGESK